MDEGQPHRVQDMNPVSLSIFGLLWVEVARVDPLVPSLASAIRATGCLLLLISLCQVTAESAPNPLHLLFLPAHQFSGSWCSHWPPKPQPIPKAK